MSVDNEKENLCTKIVANPHAGPLRSVSVVSCTPSHPMVPVSADPPQTLRKCDHIHRRGSNVPRTSQTNLVKIPLTKLNPNHSKKAPVKTYPQKEWLTLPSPLPLVTATVLQASWICQKENEPGYPVITSREAGSLARCLPGSRVWSGKLLLFTVQAYLLWIVCYVHVVPFQIIKRKKIGNVITKIKVIWYL